MSLGTDRLSMRDSIAAHTYIPVAWKVSRRCCHCSVMGMEYGNSSSTSHSISFPSQTVLYDVHSYQQHPLCVWTSLLKSEDQFCSPTTTHNCYMYTTCFCFVLFLICFLSSLNHTSITSFRGGQSDSLNSRGIMWFLFRSGIHFEDITQLLLPSIVGLCPWKIRKTT